MAGGILILAAAMGIGRFAYTPVLPLMQQVLRFNDAQAGLVASANYVGYLIGALLVALVRLDRSRDRALAGCLGVVVVTTGLMATTTSIPAWGLVRFLTGVASAGAFVLASAEVLELLRWRGAARSSGWFYAGVGLGIALTGAVVRIAGGAYAWQGAWLILAVLAAALIAVAWPLLPHTSRVIPAAPPPRPPLAARATLGVLLAAYFLEGAGYSATATFLVALVDRMPGLNTIGTSAWIVVGLAAAPSCVLWSRLAGRAGFIPALTLAYLAQACAMALPVVGSGVIVVLASALFFGGTFMGIVTLTLTLGGEIAPDRPAAVIGWLTAAFGLGQVVGPAGGGFIAVRAHAFSPVLAVAALSVLLGGILVAGLWRRDPRIGRSTAQ
ncbi:MAG: YbfB/YjiJ family MFS transporter [Chloroflexota bacterium]